MFQKFRDAGLCVVPLSGNSYPVKWGQYQEALPSNEDCSVWEKKYTDYGLVCGKVSGVIALDFDTDDAALITKVELLAGVSPVKKKGSKGFTAFYAYNGEQSKSWSMGGKVVVELLSDKRMTTIPPSKHRKTGKPYIWIDGAGLLDGLVLPALADSFVEMLDVMFKVPKREYVERVKHDVDFQDVERMLGFIDSNCSREDWIKIGMALRDEFGDAACSLWHEWSSRAAGRYKQADAQAAWRSFTGSGVGIGTLIYEAKRGGYEAETKKAIIPIAKKKNAEIKRGRGLVYDVADWITQNAIVKQPVYSFATALSIVSLIKAGKIKTTTELHPNIYVMCLGHSGSGKDACLDAIENLLKAVGLDGHIMGNPASGSGFATGMKKAKGRALLKVDEIGRFMGGINGKNSQFYHADIISMMIDIYSKSGSVYRGKQFADEEANKQIILENPYVSIIGFSVRERMTSAFSSTDALDGFLNRWLIFEIYDSPAEEFPKDRWSIPSELIRKIQTFMNEPQKKLYISPEVWDIYKQYRAMNTERKKAAGYPLDALYQRLQLQVLKLCMLLSDDGIVTSDVMNESIRFVEESLLSMKQFVDKITNSQHESDLMVVADAVRENSPITLTRLHHLTRRLKRRDRDDILAQLKEMGWVHEEKNGKTTNYHFIREIT